MKKHCQKNQTDGGRSYDCDKDNFGRLRDQNPEDTMDEIHQEKKLTTLCGDQCQKYPNQDYRPR